MLGFPPRRWQCPRVTWIVLLAVAALSWPAHGRSESPAAIERPDAIPTDFAAFADGLGQQIAAALGGSAKHWRQIAPAVHHLATQHADALGTMTEADRVAALVALARFIDWKREAAAAVPVLADGRVVIGLLDPAEGLGPREVTAIADAYGCESTIFKQQAAEQTLDGVAAEFLAAITAAVGAGKPTSVVVLGHGLPTEIQSYHIRFERLAAALLDGAAGGGVIDLADVVIICDDCFSADFHINLLDEITREAGRRRRPLTSLPVCIAGTNRACVGHADVGEKFVPHFWRDVIELYFIRKPLPEAVTLGDFFEKVDNMMYGYGRAPIVEGGHVAGYRLVDPELVQDPVVFVPLDEADLAKLREILGLPADAELPRWLDVG
ncbi:MAG: hypothetical protein ACKOCX_12920 [Planctomycetota bacterium]